MLTELKNNSWREHWFIVNIINEIPILGSFFKKKTLSESMHDAGKCLAALAGSTATMIPIIDSNKTEDMSMHIVKMTTAMIGGMVAGKVAYNGLCGGSSMLYNYLKSEPADYQIADDCADNTATNMPSDTVGKSSCRSRIC